MKLSIHPFLILFLTLGAGIAAQAQSEESTDKKEAAVENYSWALEHGSVELQASTLYNLVRFYQAFPDAPQKQVIPQLKQISYEGANEQIRYRAYLTLMALQHPELAEGLAFNNYEQSVSHYDSVAQRIHNRMLVENF